jgi:DNA gyrase subunit B
MKNLHWLAIATISSSPSTDNSVSVTDNGREFRPVSRWTTSTGKTLGRIALTELHAGGKVQPGQLQGFQVGCTAWVWASRQRGSKMLRLTVRRDSKVHVMEFSWLRAGASLKPSMAWGFADETDGRHRQAALKFTSCPYRYLQSNDFHYEIF